VLAELRAAIAGGHGADVVWSAGPVNRDGATEHAGIVERYQVLADSQPRTTFVDGNHDIAPGGVYAPTQPCLWFETCGLGGQNIVRSPDGLHFCPLGLADPQGLFGSCAVYSSGATRYAMTLAEPVVRSLQEEP